MKKKTVQLFVLLALLAAALVAFLVLRPGDEDIAEEPAADEDTVYVLGAATQRFANSVEVRNALDSYTVTNGSTGELQPLGAAESEHIIEGIDPVFLNQTTLRLVFSAVGSLPAKKVVAESGADLALYGLQSPSATVVVTYADDTATLLVGDDAPGSEGIYVALDGAVYLVDTSKVSLFREPRYHFVGQSVTEGNNQSTIPLKIVLDGGLFTEAVTIERAPDDEVAAMTGFSTYRIVSPIQIGADAQRGVAPLQMVFGLTATEVLADTSDDSSALAAYGLDEPYMTVEAQAEEIDAFTLTLSQPDDEGNVAVKSSRSPFVYRVSSASLPFLEMTLFDLQEKMIILPHIDTVSEVEVAAGDEIYRFVLSEMLVPAGGGADDADEPEEYVGELAVHLGEQQLNTDYFRKFYQTLVAAAYDSEIDRAEDAGTQEGDEAAPDAAESPQEAQSEGTTEPLQGTEDAPPILQITYRYNNGSQPDVVLFEQGPARKAVVSLNGGKPYYARSVYVDRVLEDLSKIANNEEVTAYL